MAAPRIFFRSGYHTGTNRVEVDIAHHFEKIAVPIHQYGFVAPLKEMSGSFLPPVDPSGITKREILHAAGQRDIANLQGNMNMIAHEAKGVDPIAKPESAFLKQEIETGVVSVGQKNILPAVAPEKNMIKSTRKMDAWFPCHEGKITHVRQLVNLEA